MGRKRVEVGERAAQESEVTKIPREGTRAHSLLICSVHMLYLSMTMHTCTHTRADVAQDRRGGRVEP